MWGLFAKLWLRERRGVVYRSAEISGPVICETLTVNVFNSDRNRVGVVRSCKYLRSVRCQVARAVVNPLRKWAAGNSSKAVRLPLAAQYVYTLASLLFRRIGWDQFLI